MITTDNNRILILAPHTDDAELGCGGTIAKLLSEGNQIHVATFSAPPPPGEDTHQDTLKHELFESLISLGLHSDAIILKDFKHRIFDEQRQQILDFMITMRHKLRPHLVFCPSSEDKHQDHRVVFEEAKRAFQGCSILGYDLPWNQNNFRCDIYQVLSSQHLTAKINSLNKYRSQKNRSYFQEGFINSLARVRGAMIGEEYAEAFENIQVIVR